MDHDEQNKTPMSKIESREKLIKSCKNAKYTESIDTEYANAIKEYSEYEASTEAIIRTAKKAKNEKNHKNNKFYDELQAEYFDHQFEMQLEPIVFDRAEENDQWLKNIFRIEKDKKNDFFINYPHITDPIERRNILVKKLNHENLNEEFLPIINKLLTDYNKVFYIDGAGLNQPM